MSSGKKFKRVLLHAGLGKTGTSSIQDQLLEHAQILGNEHDIHFPHVFNELRQPFNGNHSSLLNLLFLDHNKPPQSYFLADFQSEKDAGRYSANISRNFENGFAASKASQLLISAEGLGHFSESRLIRFSKWLMEFAEKIEIVVCLRHPMGALSSEIQQRLTLGYVLEDLYEKPPRYHFKNLFNRLEAAFPQCRFIVYDFAQAVKHPSGLVGCFYEKIDLDPGMVSQQPRHSNESMSHEAALLLSALNHIEPLLNGNKRNKSRSPGDIQDFLSIAGEKYQAPQKVYNLLEREIVNDLTWLREQHGLEFQPVTINHRTEYRCFSEESIQDIALRLGKLSKYQRPLRIIGKALKLPGFTGDSIS